MTNSKYMTWSTALSRVLQVNLIAGAAGVIMIASPAFAQEASQPSTQATPAGGLGDIMVTARRVEENLQSVPVAVTALSGEALEQKSIMKIEDLSRSVPGFTAQQSFQSNTPVYTIRGQHGDTNATANTEPAVQVYFAEMNQARAIGTTGSFFDIASVQVLKGPQGTLFGRNSTGGAVLITPRAPEHEFGGYGQASVGDFGYTDFEGALNLPLGDKAALRIGGKIADRDGYIDNIVTGDDSGEINNDSARVSLLLEPNDSITSTFIGTYFKSKVDGNTIKLLSVSPDWFARGPLSAFGPLSGILAAAYSADAAAENALGPYRTAAGGPQFSTDEVYSVQNNTEIALNDNLTVKNIIGYKNTKQDQSSDFYGGSYSYFLNHVTSESNFYSEELQLQGKYDKLDFVLGAYLLRDEVDLAAQTAVFASIPGILSFVPGLNFAFPASDFIRNDYTIDSQSVFAHGNYDLSSFINKLSISAGIRITHDEKEANFRTFDVSGTPNGILGATCVLTGVTFPAPDVSQCSTPAEVSSTEATYDISLNYQATENLLIYLAHRHGYRAGGFDIIPPNATRLSYEPEFVDDIELGVKSDFDLGSMPARLNVAGYYQDYQDIQHLIDVTNPNGSVANATANVAAAEIYGAELEFTIQPIPALEFSATYAYTHADNTEYNQDYTSPLTGVTTTLDLSDSDFTYVAENQWSLSGRYTLPLPEQYGQVALSATWYGQSEMIPSDNSRNCGPDGLFTRCLNVGTEVPAYDLVNVRADWKNVAGKGFDLSLFVNNVADTEYLSTVLGLNGPLGITSGSYGPPRMVGLVLKVPFGAEAN